LTFTEKEYNVVNTPGPICTIILNLQGYKLLP